MKFNTPYDRDLTLSAEKGGGDLITDSTGAFSARDFFQRVMSGLTAPVNNHDFDADGSDSALDSVPDEVDDLDLSDPNDQFLALKMLDSLRKKIAKSSLTPSSSSRSKEDSGHLPAASENSSTVSEVNNETKSN